VRVDVAEKGLHRATVLRRAAQHIEAVQNEAGVLQYADELADVGLAADRLELASQLTTQLNACKNSVHLVADVCLISTKMSADLRPRNNVNDDGVATNSSTTSSTSTAMTSTNSSSSSSNDDRWLRSSVVNVELNSDDDNDDNDDGKAASEDGPIGSLAHQWALLEQEPEEPISENAQSFANGAMLVVEQYYDNLFRSLDERQERCRTLSDKMSRLNLSSDQIELKMRQLAEKETQYIRSRRVRLTGNTFESIRVIGRGAFGEVSRCPLLCCFVRRL
jgi:hypothetical protein